MPFTAINTKAVGGTIARSEVLDLLKNLHLFYRPATVRVYKADGTHQVTTTLAAIDWLPAGGDWHSEWRYEGGDGSEADATYNLGTGGLWLNLGDVDPGIWIVGAQTSLRNTDDTSTSSHTRRLLLRRSDGSTPTEIAEDVSTGDVGARRSSFQLFGLANFTSTFDRVELMGRVQPSGTDDVIEDRRWGIRLGSATALSNDYDPGARQESDTNSDLDIAWNRIRLNQYRIERRPTGQRYKTGADQAIVANTETLVTMGAEDWDTDTGMAVPSVFPNLVIAQQPGWYLATAQVTFEGFDAASSYASVSIKKNASSVVASANAAEVDHFDTVVRAADIVQLDATDYVSVYATTGANTDIQASRGTHITLTLLSSNHNVSSDRQLFAECPPPSQWPDVANMSSDDLPVGTLRVISDIQDRLWHRPVIKCSIADSVEVSTDGTWTDVDLDDADIDFTDLEDTHGLTIFGGGGIRIPWDGLWLVGARLQFRARDADGKLRGDDGFRGARIALGDNMSAGAIITPAMNASGHGWVREWCEPVIINRRGGQDLKLQAFCKSTTDAFAAAVVTAANLWAVEIGQGYTRVPR